MKIKVKWYYFELKHLIRTIKRRMKFTKVNPKRLAGKIILSGQEGNDIIAKKIRSGEPFMICRFGSTELNAVRRCLEKEILGKRKDTKLEYAMELLCSLSGFFPKDISLASQFSKVIIDACIQSDFYGVWFLPMEDYLIDYCSPTARLTTLRGLEPWYWKNPWSLELKGKKILIIHPFEDTIINQYKKRECLFQGSDILPEFELKTLKAVQTIAGEKDERFKNWFEAFEYMYNQAIAIDFDIAIIGCGAYGMPLAAKLKAYGKQAIHLGGATQLMFGIMGKRWENNEYIIKFKNEYWTRPKKEEKPEHADKVEKACYW